MEETTKTFADVIKDIDFTVIFDEVKSCAPYIIPAVLGFAGFRKAWGWVQGAIAGA